MDPIKSKSQEKTSNTKSSPQTIFSARCKNQRIFNNVVIKLIKGTIETEGVNCDAIVNSIKLRSYQEGKIADAIYKAGGSGYELECRCQLYGLTVDGIGCTSGTFVGCKSIYHIPFLSSDRTLAWLSNRIKDCLNQADRTGMNSIAIPTIGTGGIGLNANDVAKEMIQVAVTFAQQKSKNLQEIHFIVYPTDSNSHAAFEQALSNSIMKSYPRRQLVDILTKSDNSYKLDHKGKCRLLFKAQSNASQVPIAIHVYHGNVNDAEASAIIDMTALCSRHATTDNHVDFVNYADSRHTSLTLQYLQLSNYKIYRVCPYGCLAGFGTLLTHLVARGENSVAIPLLDIEMNAANIDYIVDLIEFVIINHQQGSNSIHSFDFIIGYQDRSTEIATWMQDKITNKPLQFKWTVVQPVSVENFGMNVYYVANDKAAIDNMKKSIITYGNTWTRHEIMDEDYLNALEPKLWYQIRLKFWSEFNTIVIRKETTNGISIFGFETDIMKTVSHIYKLSKTSVKEKADQEVQQFTAEAAQWYAIIYSNRVKFETKLNYEIEKNYNIYCKDETKETFYIDSDCKIVDYRNMTIKNVAKGIESPIGKLAIQEIAIPDNWKYNKKEDIADGCYSLVDVTNWQELNKIKNIPSLSELTISKVQRIQNWNLYRRYQIMKAEVTEAVKKYKPSAQVEKCLFHGTTKDNLDSICKRGFDRDYSGSAAGSVHGTGTYFAVKAELSQRYGDGLLLVRVLTGIYTQSSGSNKPNLSIIPGSKSERVHSVVDNVNNPSMFVVSNDNSAYPEYILHVAGQ